jgi:hypothetical protein
VGYYPPVLGRGSGNGSQPVGQLGFGRDLLVPPLTLSGTTSNLAIQQWNSFTSLPEYLLGYGSRTADGYGFEASAAAGANGGLEKPPLGIRHPGRDGVWGAYVSPRQQSLALGSFGAQLRHLCHMPLVRSLVLIKRLLKAMSPLRLSRSSRSSGRAGQRLLRAAR